MNLAKASGWSGRGTPVEDAVVILQAMQDLLREELEFPIKVDGAQTLPYASRVQQIDAKRGLLHLKLIRPLPHELAVGAAFQMLFSVGEQRFEAPSVFQGREGYLLYRFSVPARMYPMDRRRHKRFPFRPREKAYVVAQDAAVPGYGFSGPLVNLSLGGFAFRVDRVLRLTDHLRVTPGLGFFERGKSFPMIKIRDLPNLPLFDARGILANARERGNGEIIVGVQFGELRDAELRDLQLVLTIREGLQRAPAATGAEGSRSSSPRSPAEAKGAVARVAPAGSKTPDALRRLGRRCTRIVLVMGPGPVRDQVQGALGSADYLRVETVDLLEQALAELQNDRSPATPVLVVEAAPEADLPLAPIRAAQEAQKELRELPVALIMKAETRPNLDDPLIRLLPWPTAEELGWLPLLDELAGLDGMP